MDDLVGGIESEGLSSDACFGTDGIGGFASSSKLLEKRSVGYP